MKPRQKGYSAWENDGARLWENPYDEDDAAYEKWREGWHQARKEEWADRIRRTCRQERVDGIRVMSAQDDRVCGPCAARDGEFFSCEEAIENPPIPHESCENDYCRCVYETVVQDSLLSDLLDL
jgi:hypothetical protein